MASALKRGNSYQIRVSVGRDSTGKYAYEVTTWTPPAGLTEKKEKAASSNKKTKGTSQRVVSIKSLNVNGEKLLSLYKVFAVIGSTCDVYLLPENKMIFIRNGQHLAILMTVV